MPSDGHIYIYIYGKSENQDMHSTSVMSLKSSRLCEEHFDCEVRRGKEGDLLYYLLFVSENHMYD